jgi:hypothetical protein
MYWVNIDWPLFTSSNRIYYSVILKSQKLHAWVYYGQEEGNKRHWRNSSSWCPTYGNRVVLYFNWSVGRELVVLHTIFFPCSVTFWCMVGLSVKVWMKNLLYWFIGGQTHFTTSWHEPMEKVLCSNLHTGSKHAQETYPTWKTWYANQPTPDQNSSWFKEPTLM